jgi:hypothetical protein
MARNYSRTSHTESVQRNMTDKPIREVIIQDPVIIEKRGGYRGGDPASSVAPPPNIPTGSVIPAEMSTVQQGNNPTQGEGSSKAAPQK